MSMSMSTTERIKVLGEYIHPWEYVFRDEKQNEVLRVVAGEEFEVCGTRWFPTRVENKTGFGTVIVCNCEHGRNLHLLHKKWGYLAITEEAARAGMFLAPRNAIEGVLIEHGFSPMLVKYSSDDSLRFETTTGGKVKIGRCKYDYLECLTDGNVSKTTKENNLLFANIVVEGGTYCIDAFRGVNGIWAPKKILLTANADHEAISNILRGKFVPPKR